MQQSSKNSFFAWDSFLVGSKEFQVFRLSRLEDANLTQLSRLPFSIKILLENVLRNDDGRLVTEDDVKKLAAYNPANVVKTEVPYMPDRVCNLLLAWPDIAQKYRVSGIIFTERFIGEIKIDAANQGVCHHQWR